MLFSLLLFAGRLCCTLCLCVFFLAGQLQPPNFPRDHEARDQRVGQPARVQQVGQPARVQRVGQPARAELQEDHAS
jgi:hypothetical protein